jgi:hypothetical protein
MQKENEHPITSNSETNKQISMKTENHIVDVAPLDRIDDMSSATATRSDL